MADVTADAGVAPRPNLDQGMNLGSLAVFGGLLGIGLLFTAYSIYSDISATGAPTRTVLPFLLLGVALLIALGFEFVNGFHDTANAVATVIYTHSLPPNFAVIWSGSWNFIGVLTSSGAVAFSIVSLLPVELILQVGSDAGFAMVFALLIAAIMWNLGTWYLGLPASSSHTLIGSIIGVGVTNALLHGRDGTSGVDWSKATEIGEALIASPLFGFALAAISNANTMAKPAWEPTCRISSTGRSETMPKATAPEDNSTPKRLNRPDHTTATCAGSARV